LLSRTRPTQRHIRQTRTKTGRRPHRPNFLVKWTKLSKSVELHRFLREPSDQRRGHRTATEPCTNTGSHPAAPYWSRWDPGVAGDAAATGLPIAAEPTPMVQTERTDPALRTALQPRCGRIARTHALLGTPSRPRRLQDQGRQPWVADRQQRSTMRSPTLHGRANGCLRQCPPAAAVLAVPEVVLSGHSGTSPWWSLEGVKAEDRAGQQDQGIEPLGVSLIADPQPPEATQPGPGPFDGPAVTAQPL
jgi:hypothetical protein